MGYKVARVKPAYSRNLWPTFKAIFPSFRSLFAGLYEELRRIEPDFAFSPRDTDGVADQRAFIVLGFKTLDDASARGSFQSEVCVLGLYLLFEIYII